MGWPGRKYNSSEYRYGFNGKEKDDEGEFGSITNYDYGFRIYNPAVGRFLSVDPLTKAYPELTPYQFASNRPIDGIDLDGLEYLDKDESNFKLIMGQTFLSRSRFYEIYGTHGNVIAGSVRTDAYGLSYTGATLPVQQNILLDDPDKYPLYSGQFAKSLNDIGKKLQTDFHKIPAKRRNGKSNRKRNRDMKSYQNSAAAARGAGKIGLTFIAVDLAHDAYKSVTGYLDMVEDTEQSKFVDMAWEAVGTALDYGLIPTENQNVNDISRIADFVLRGKLIEDNAALQEVAVKVSKQVAQNYRYPVDIEIPSSGMDNFPAQPVDKTDLKDKEPDQVKVPKT